jgi:TetR/AcrR family hemagglutinin/protease transcriptional regulator
MESIISKPRKRAKRMAPADRKEQITRAAIQIFSQLGISNASHAQVAERANVSIPTVFLYMPNPQALIDSVLLELDNYLSEIVRSAACTRPNATDKLLAVVNTFAKRFDDEVDVDYGRSFLDWGAVDRDDTWPQYMEFQDQILNEFQSIVCDGQRRDEIPKSVNAVWAAHLIMGSANMVAQMKFRNRASEDVANFVAALVHGAVLAE